MYGNLLHINCTTHYQKRDIVLRGCNQFTACVQELKVGRRKRGDTRKGWEREKRKRKWRGEVAPTVRWSALSSRRPLREDDDVGHDIRRQGCDAVATTYYLRPTLYATRYTVRLAASIIYTGDTVSRRCVYVD